MAREPASSHPWKQKLSPLDRLQTLRQTNRQGGTASLPLGAVSCSVKKASQLARLYRCLLAPAFASGRAPVTATRKPLLAACLLFPAARLTLQHAQSRVLLVCRQFIDVNGLECPAWAEHDSRVSIRHGWKGVLLCIGKCTAALMQCKHRLVDFTTRHIDFAATNTRDDSLRAYTPTSHRTIEKCTRKYSGFM